MQESKILPSNINKFFWITIFLIRMLIQLKNAHCNSQIIGIDGITGELINDVFESGSYNI
jgi:hypothetical protein